MTEIDRNSYIGGSDVGPLLLGEVHGDTPYTVWQHKTGRVTRPNLDGLPDIERGKRLQADALDAILSQCPDTDYADEVLVSADECFPASGHVDRLGAGWLVEAKCPRASRFFRVREHGPDHAHVLQVQYYLMLTGITRGWLTYFCADAWESETFEVVASERVHEIIRQRCADFWVCVQADEPPEMDAAIELPEVRTGVTDATAVQSALARRWRELEDEITERTGIIAGIKDELMRGWDPGASKIIHALGSLTYQCAATRQAFDTARFRRENPDIYEQYIRKSETRAHLRPYWRKK